MSKTIITVTLHNTQASQKKGMAPQMIAIELTKHIRLQCWCSPLLSFPICFYMSISCTQRVNLFIVSYYNDKIIMRISWFSCDLIWEYTLQLDNNFQG